MIERIREEDAQRATSEESKPPPQQKSEIIEIEKPYIGMPERYIGMTKWGNPDYSSFVVGGTSYIFYGDDDYLVTVQYGEVTMIQKFRDGKLLWSETETGIHSLTR